MALVNIRKVLFSIRVSAIMTINNGIDMNKEFKRANELDDMGNKTTERHGF